MAVTCPKCGYNLHEFDMTPYKILELIVAFDWRTLSKEEILRYKSVLGNTSIDGARALQTSDDTRLFIINNMTLYSFELGSSISQVKWVLFHVANEEYV